MNDSAVIYNDNKGVFYSLDMRMLAHVNAIDVSHYNRASACVRACVLACVYVRCMDAWRCG